MTEPEEEDPTIRKDIKDFSFADLKTFTPPESGWVDQANAVRFDWQGLWFYTPTELTWADKSGYQWRMSVDFDGPSYRFSLFSSSTPAITVSNSTGPFIWDLQGTSGMPYTEPVDDGVELLDESVTLTGLERWWRAFRNGDRLYLETSLNGTNWDRLNFVQVDFDQAGVWLIEGEMGHSTTFYDDTHGFTYTASQNPPPGKPPVRYTGVRHEIIVNGNAGSWTASESYGPGAIVSHQGMDWISWKASQGVEPQYTPNVEPAVWYLYNVPGR